jgi:hypothetical protein
MEETKKYAGFKWRWIAIGAMVVLGVASLLVVGGMSYTLGREHGYSKLEKEIVYALALNNSTNVGKFMVDKLKDGRTTIALKERALSENVEALLHK